MGEKPSGNSTSFTIQRALDTGIKCLSPHSDSAKVDVDVLLCEALACNRAHLLTHQEQRLNDTQRNRFLTFLEQRVTGKPVSYIIGHQDFWTLSLQVNESTLIPRPETELLVEEVLKLPVGGVCDCLDLGTGTGAIALAIAVEKPSWSVLGCDRIQQAVTLAMTNQKRNGVGNATFIQSDWFTELHGKTFDIIVSNPPYVEANSHYLNEGDLRFEPLSALTSEEDGMADIRKIVQDSPHYLNSKGWLCLEHGFEQGDAVRTCLAHNGFLQIKTVKDYAGLDRVTLGCLPD